MINIKDKQQQVLEQFKKHVEYILFPELATSKDMGTANPKSLKAAIGSGAKTAKRNSVDSGQKKLVISNGQLRVEKGSNSKQNESTGNRVKLDKVEQDAKRTMELSLDLTADLEHRIMDLNNLKERAELTEKAVSA